MDCTIALSLDPLYTKAYLRRGTARMGLQKFSTAKEDYERVLSLEPQNKKAKSDLEIIEKVSNIIGDKLACPSLSFVGVNFYIL